MSNSNTNQDALRENGRIPEGMMIFDLLSKIIQINKQYLIAAALVVTFGVVFGHIYYIPRYMTSSKVTVINDSGTLLEKYMASHAGDVKDYESTMRPESYLQIMQADDFYPEVAKKLLASEDFNRLKIITPREMSMMSWGFWKRVLKGQLRPRTFHPADSLIAPKRDTIEEVSYFLAHTTEGSPDDNNGIDIQVVTLDAFTSMTVANLVANELIRIADARELAEIQEIQNYIRKRLEQTESEVRGREGEVVKLRKKYEMISSGPGGVHADELKTVETELEQAEIDLSNGNKTIGELQAYLKTIDDQALHGQQDSDAYLMAQRAQALQNRLDLLRQQKSMLLSQNFTATDSEVVEVDSQITLAASRLRQIVQTSGLSQSILTHYDPVSARKKIGELREQAKFLSEKIATLKNKQEDVVSKLKQYPELEQANQNLSRMNDIDFSLINSLKEKLSQLDIKQISISKKLSMTLPSGIPDPVPRPSFIPKWLFSMVVSQFLIILFLLALEIMRQRIHNSRDFQDAGVDLIGSVPFIEEEGQKKIVVTLPFQYLRTHLIAAEFKGQCKMRRLLLTSPGPEDGKTYVASHLAVAFAQLGHRVIAIDCSFQSRSLAGNFNYANTKGLSSLLSLQAFFDEVVIRGVVPNLDLLPSGDRYLGMTERLEGGLFQQLLDHATSLYDYVLIDAPPIIQAPETVTMGKYVDAIVMVAHYRKTRSSDLTEASRLVREICGKRCFGVLNGIIDVAPKMSEEMNTVVDLKA